MSINVKHRIFRVMVVLVLAIMSGKVFAITCSTSTNPPLHFGAYDPGSSTPLDGVGGVRVRCAAQGQGGGGLVSYSILMSAGTGSFASRQMLSGSDVLTYNLYINSSYTTIWGDGSAGTSFVSDSYQLNSGSQTTDYSVYGRMPAYQNVPTGTYSDSITITVNY